MCLEKQWKTTQALGALDYIGDLEKGHGFGLASSLAIVDILVGSDPTNGSFSHCNSAFQVNETHFQKKVYRQRYTAKEYKCGVLYFLVLRTHLNKLRFPGRYTVNGTLRSKKTGCPGMSCTWLCKRRQESFPYVSEKIKLVWALSSGSLKKVLTYVSYDCGLWVTQNATARTVWRRKKRIARTMAYKGRKNKKAKPPLCDHGHSSESISFKRHQETVSVLV